MNNKALWYMLLLAIQFGIQPVLTRQYTSKDLPKSVVIFVQECCKFVMAWCMFQFSGRANRQQALQHWTVANWMYVAMIPAALYALQNVLALRAYQHLDALTFNVLNQTKTLSAALCCYFVLGSRQSKMQIVALFLLLGSALVMEQIVTWQTIQQLLLLQIQPSSLSSSLQQQQHQQQWLSLFWRDNNKDSSSSSTSQGTWFLSTLLQQEHFVQGVLPILMASFISGLAGALSQKNLQSSSSSSSSSNTNENGGNPTKAGRDPYLFSMELCAASALLLLGARFLSSITTNNTTASLSADATTISTRTTSSSSSSLLGTGWTYTTFIPILTNSAGGILVGLVTKHAGSVQKGFALIFGIFISGLVQQYMASSSTSTTNHPNSEDGGGGGGVATHQVVGGILAAISLWMHATHPPSPSPKLSSSSSRNRNRRRDGEKTEKIE